jgi:hypothetical protein
LSGIPAKDLDVISIAIRTALLKPREMAKSYENLSQACIRPQSTVFVQVEKGGALASTHRRKLGRHVEDGSLASLKTGPKQINADHEDLALAA